MHILWVPEMTGIILSFLFALSSTQNYSFPDDFLFGAASSSYQVEGAWNVDGKTESIWDHLLHQYPNFTADGQNGDVACDSYHLYKEDVKILRELGVDIYRFSISWPRIMPTEDVSLINQPGIDYYNNLIDELLANGIQPMVTMHHWELPQWLQDLGGWTNPLIVDYFESLARVLFDNFGDRVKWWITLNEPQYLQFDLSFEAFMVPTPNKSAENFYLIGYHILLAHARIYHLYDEVYRAEQKGKITITLVTTWHEPRSNSVEDIEATERGLQFYIGFLAHPIYSTEGDYPQLIRDLVDKNSKTEGLDHSRLVTLSKEMVDYIRGTYDYFGLNYYTSNLCSTGYSQSPLSVKDAEVVCSPDPSWPIDPTNWRPIVPWGLRKMLSYIHKNYNAPDIMITENGTPDDGALDDQHRIDFYKSHYAEVLKSIHEDGVHVTGFVAWSLMDSFEWNSGYTRKFGLYHVNFTDPARPRTAKASAKFLKDLIQTRQLPEDISAV